MSTKRWRVFGISGATCSGKSTLAKQLHEALDGSVLIRQDDYFLPPDDPRHTKLQELNHMNWEILTAIDMEKMHADILKIIEAPPSNNPQKSGNGLLILDGFILFAYKPILQLCDLKYFLTLTKEECWNRRKNRVYNPPDVPGYFEKVVWPEYQKYLSEIKQDDDLHKSIKIIDGTNSKEEILRVALTEIREILL